MQSIFLFLALALIPAEAFAHGSPLIVYSIISQILAFVIVSIYILRKNKPYMVKLVAFGVLFIEICVFLISGMASYNANILLIEGLNKLCLLVSIAIVVFIMRHK